MVKVKQIPIRLAYCTRCRLQFEWLPRHWNSTKGEDIYPRCPYCGSYRTTNDKGLLNREQLEQEEV